MTVAPPAPAVGGLLRGWRRRRRLSQLDLSVEAQVSARHLSFVETGRSKPSRELLLHLAEHLDVPLRERNTLLLAGGYAPSYRETALDQETMAPVRAALERILVGSEPFPAVVIDRRWDLVSANASALRIMTEGVAAELLTPPINVLRMSLHPEGMAPRIANLAEFSAHLLERLDRQVASTADAELEALYDELRQFPGVHQRSPAPAEPASLLFVPLVLRVRGGGELSFVSTVATFGTALDITMAELAIESFFPADAATAAALQPPSD